MLGLIVGVNLEMLAVFFKRAFGAVGVGGGKRGAHVFKPDAVFEQGAWIEFDAHGGQRTAADIHLPDACTCDSFCARTVEAGVVNLALRKRREVSARIMIGASAGLTLR